MPEPQTHSGTPRFRLGEQVRSIQGLRDPDYPDIPMSGWVGTVIEVDARKGSTSYAVLWSQETLASLHPVFKKRCDRDGLDYEQAYLADEDLEPYDGQPLNIEQPTAIETRTLSPANQDDRVKMILGATGDDPVPDVNEKTLIAFRDYLSKHLSFPLDARHCPEDGPDSKATVVGLPDPDDYECDEFYGLLCEIRLGKKRMLVPLSEIEVKKGTPNHPLVEDYAYWFWNWR